MPEIYEVEVVTGETATAVSVPAGNFELEVHLDNVAKVGQIPVAEAVEVAILGTVKVPSSGLVSADANNAAIISPNDGLIYVPQAGTGAFSDAAVAAFVADEDSDTYAAITALQPDLSGYVETTDPRLSDARTPTAHKATHATGGGDALSPADIGAATPQQVADGDTATLSAAQAHAQGLVDVLTAASPATLDTLAEIADALGEDPNFAATMTAALAARVRHDAAQSLTVGEQAQARSNIGLGDAATKNTGTTAGTVAAGNDSRITGAIPSSLIDAKGDLIVGTADNTVTRLPASTNGHVLTLDSTAAAGVKWAAAAAGGGGSSLPDPGFLVKEGGATTDGTYAPGWAMQNVWGTLTLPWQWIYWVPYYLTHERVLHGLSFTTTAAAASAYLGLYTADITWQPDTRLFGSSELDVASAATYNINNLALTLPPGRYLAALQSSSGNLSLRTPAGGRGTFILESAGVNPVGATYRQLRRNVGYAPFPASGSTIRWGGGGDHPGQDGLPYIFMRFSA